MSRRSWTARREGPQRRTPSWDGTAMLAPDDERQVVGRRILPDSTVAAVGTVSGNRLTLSLEPQEAQLLALER